MCDWGSKTSGVTYSVDEAEANEVSAIRVAVLKDVWLDEIVFE